MPGVGAADDQSSHQQHERPGMRSRMTPIPPEAEHRAERASAPPRTNRSVRTCRGRTRRLACPSRCALSLRAAFAATCRTKTGSSSRADRSSSSPMLKLRESADKAAFHFGDRSANVPLLLIERQKLALHRVVELAKIRAADGVAHGDQHIRAGLDQHAFIDGDINRARPLSSRRSGFRAPAPQRSRAGGARVRTIRRAVSATMRETSVFSANISIGKKDLKIHAALRRLGLGFGLGLFRLADRSDHVKRALRVVLELVAQNAFAAVERSP